MAIPELEARQLDRDYMAWRARQIEAGNIAKPPVPSYDQSKKYVPPIIEANRKTLGTLPELEKELAGYQASRKAGKTINFSRASAVADEVRRLKIEEADMLWSLQEQANYEKFVRGPKITQPGTRFNPLKKAVGWWKGLRTRNKLLLGSAGVIAATIAFGSKEDHNTIEGLHPFSDGLGTQILRQHSEFGSGYVGLKGLLFGEAIATWQATKDGIYKEGLNTYQLYSWEKSRGAREAFAKFAEQKENQLKFPAMGDRETFAAHMRGEITEFKEQFASRWDPLRKLAKELYGNSNEAFQKLTTRPEFRGAVSQALKGPGKLLGRGEMGEARAYVGEMVLQGQKHKFEFVAKRALARGAETAEDIVKEQENLFRYARAEAGALRKLGEERAPSLYGTGHSFGVDRNTLIMEKFNLGTPLAIRKKEKIALPSGLTTEIERTIAENPLSEDELVDLRAFMKSAHKKGVTHTDLHTDNLVRAINPETGKSEIAVLDWGMANRFQEVGGIGGTQARVIEETGAAAVMQGIIRKKIGREVSGKEFSEIADIFRVEGHRFGRKAPRSSRQAVNSLYHFSRSQLELADAMQELNMTKRLPDISPALLESAQSEVIKKKAQMSNASEVLNEVADSVSDYILGGYESPSVPKVAESLLPQAFAKLKKQVSSSIKKDEVAYAETIVMDTMRASTVEMDNTAATMAHRAKKAAVERNRRFEEVSRRSVGAGLRASAVATKGHTNFGSTRQV